MSRIKPRDLMLTDAKDIGGKNSDEYKVKGALRKQRSRMLLKKYEREEHKWEERERNRYAKIKKNHTKVTINTSP